MGIAVQSQARRASVMMVCALIFAVACGDSGASPNAEKPDASQRSKTTDSSAGAADPAALCQFVSSAKDDQAAVDFDAAQARGSLDALHQASELSLSDELDAAIQQLIPLYTALARGDNSDAFATLDAYATKHCRFEDAEDINACALVTHDDAQVLAETPLNPAEQGGQACAYGGVEGGPLAKVEVYIGDGAKNYLEVDRRLGFALKPVADLGDEAYLKPSGDVLYFQKSGIWMVIVVIRLEGDYSQPLEQLGREIAARL